MNDKIIFSRRFSTVFQIFFICVFAGQHVAANADVLDSFDSLDGWRVVPSDGVKAEIRACEGKDGRGLRLEYDFTRGAGFCVLRREVLLDLPAEYRFGFQIRGECLPNNLEFKLIDPSSENVWWVNQRAFEFPSEWKKVTLRSRRFSFAWGPSGGKTPLSKLGAIEFAIAASSGGKGTIDLDQLTFESIPPRGEPKPIRVSFGQVKDGKPEWVELPADWKIESSVGPPWPTAISLNLGGIREFGGLIIDWDETNFPQDLDVDASLDGKSYETVAQVRGMRGGRRYIQIPDGEAAFLRIRVLVASNAESARLTRLELAPPEFGQSANAMWSRIARDAPRGWYPRYFLGEQQPWTVIGVEGDDSEALMDAAGAIELGKGGPRLEPFLYMDGKLITWADVQLSHDGGIAPRATWTYQSLTLQISACALEPRAMPCAEITYQVTNVGPKRSLALFVAIRPFQVLPPWHELNLTGGASFLPEITPLGEFVLARPYLIAPRTISQGFGCTTFASGEIVESLAVGKLSNGAATRESRGGASAAYRFDWQVPTCEVRFARFRVPLRRFDAEGALAHAEAESAGRAITAEGGARVSAACRVALRLPQTAYPITATFNAMQDYILINADGPRIQPGSRTYERSWIRDGALTGTALLVTGHGDKMRDFLDWYAPFQYESGKIPCVVDSRGPDPVPENDSHGEYIYAVATYYRFTHDREFLNRHFPRVVKAVEYIESLRAQRMTDEFKTGPVEKRMLYGLVPESISHEGYSAKPMHSYWDGFFTLRGLSDAAYLAAEATRLASKDDPTPISLPIKNVDESSSKPDSDDMKQWASGLVRTTRKWQSLSADYRKCMYDSLRLTMDLHKIDYIPGCAELGDFDATSTAIGVFPCGERGRAPEPQLTNTFDRYLKFFRDRRDGKIEWREFTPYELRLVGVFVRLGRVEEAHELLDWFMQYQQPAGWRQWGEVAYRDPLYPGFVGDMPHTWVGGEFVNSVRAMLVYEDEAADALIVAAGVPWRWLNSPEGVSFENFPTEYGQLSASLKMEDGKMVRVRMSGLSRIPAGGIVLKMPRKPEKVEFPAKAVKYEIRADGVWLQEMCPEVLIHVKE